MNSDILLHFASFLLANFSVLSSTNWDKKECYEKRKTFMKLYHVYVDLFAGFQLPVVSVLLFLFVFFSFFLYNLYFPEILS